MATMSAITATMVMIVVDETKIFSHACHRAALDSVALDASSPRASKKSIPRNEMLDPCLPLWPNGTFSK